MATEAAPRPRAAEGTPAVRADTLSATAECSGQRQLSGIGFRLTGAAGGAYLTQLVPGANMRRVRAVTGGLPAGSGTVTAIGICMVPQPAAGSVEDTVASGGTWPQTATARTQSGDGQVYGVGGRVTGADDVFLDGLVPDPEQEVLGAASAVLHG